MIGVGGDVGGDFAVGHPEAGEFGFTAEDDRFFAAGGGGLVLIPADGEIHFYIAAGSGGLALEVVGEVLRVLPEVAVDVDHAVHHRTRNW